jgi:hypothetical protein
MRIQVTGLGYRRVPEGSICMLGVDVEYCWLTSLSSVTPWRTGATARGLCTGLGMGERELVRDMLETEDLVQHVRAY